jgi:hypothetical protein
MVYNHLNSAYEEQKMPLGRMILAVMVTLAIAGTSQAKEEECYWVKPPPKFKPYQIEVYRREWGGYANPHRFYYVRKVKVKDKAIGQMGRHLYWVEPLSTFGPTEEGWMFADRIDGKADNCFRTYRELIRMNTPNGSPRQEILAAHNKYRTEVGVPPLKWSIYLANRAQAYANYLASKLLFEHSKVKGEGENLWRGTSHRFSFTQMIDSFGREKQYFKYGVFPNVSNTGNWIHVGHYTQVVWRNTRRVGCAGTDGRDGYYRLVCRYYPAGNIMNERVF